MYVPSVESVDQLPLETLSILPPGSSGICDDPWNGRGWMALMNARSLKCPDSAMAPSRPNKLTQ